MGYDNMNLLKTNKAILNNKTLTTAITSIVLLVVVLYIYASIIPTATDAGSQFNNTARCEAAGGYYCSTGSNCTTNATNACGIGTIVTYTEVPLNGLFSSTGVIFIVIMAALLIAIVLAFLPSKKK